MTKKVFNNLTTYSERLQYWMTRKGISVGDLSGMSGVSKAGILKHLSATANPRIETVDRLATALEIEIDELYPGDIPTPKEGTYSYRLYISMQKKKYNKRQLALRAGTNQSTVKNHLMGKRVNQTVVRSFANALGTTYEWLWMGIGPREETEMARLMRKLEAMDTFKEKVIEQSHIIDEMINNRREIARIFREYYEKHPQKNCELAKSLRSLLEKS